VNHHLSSKVEQRKLLPKICGGIDCESISEDRIAVDSEDGDRYVVRDDAKWEMNAERDTSDLMLDIMGSCRKSVSITNNNVQRSRPPQALLTWTIYRYFNLRLKG